MTFPERAVAQLPTRMSGTPAARGMARVRAGAAGLLCAVGASGLLAGAACAPERPADRTAGPPRVEATAADTDDFGAPLPTDASASARVVSLNPTATEILFAIGAESKLVGRGTWDTFPAQAQAVPAVGDGIRPNVEAVLAAKPTLVILYAAAENRAAATAFARAGVRVMAMRVDHIAQFFALTHQLGIATGASERATAVHDSVQRTLDLVRSSTASAPKRTVVWPVWQQPVMVIGHGSYLDELLDIAGARNAFTDLDAPSPTVSLEEIARRDPELVVTSTSGAARLQADAAWRAVRAVRDGRFIIDDPAVTGRPSVVLGMGAVALARALHPELANRLPVVHP